MGEINWSSNHPAIRLLPDKHCKGNTKPYLCTVTYKGSIAPWKAGHSGHSKSSRRNREASPRPTLSYEETLLQVLRSVPRALSIQLPADPEYNIRKDRIPLSDTFTLSESAGFNGHFEGPARFGNATQFNTNLANARRGHITLKNGRFVMRDDWIDSPHQMARDSDAEFEFSQMDGKATMVFSRSSSGRLTARRARAHEIASPFRYSFKDIKAFAQDAIGRRPIGEDRADAEFNTSEYDTEMSISGAGSLASEESIPGQPYRSMALSENSAYDILISNHNSDHSQTKDQDESISGRTTLAINRKNNYRPSSDSAPSSHHHRSPQRDGGKKDIRELEQKRNRPSDSIGDNRRQRYRDGTDPSFVTYHRSSTNGSSPKQSSKVYNRDGDRGNMGSAEENGPITHRIKEARVKGGFDQLSRSMLNKDRANKTPQGSLSRDTPLW